MKLYQDNIYYYLEINNKIYKFESSLTRKAFMLGYLIGKQED